MKRALQYLLLSLTVATGVGSGFAQVTTGTPPFGSYGGAFDVINLGNLNVHFAIPVFRRSGRGNSFHYSLTYDGSIWTPGTSGGAPTWVPVGGWGWQSQTDAVTGYIPAPTVTNSTCTYFDGRSNRKEPVTTYRYAGFVDPLGTFHAAHLIVVSGGVDCGLETGSVTSMAIDGSGWSVTVPDGIVSSRSGAIWNVPVGNRSGSAKVTDTNGNQITTSNGTTFYDTLSATTAALTISGTAPSPVSYTYTSPSGALAHYTMNYTAYTVKTNFGTSNSSGLIHEYGPLSNSLVSSISLPDGTSYTFSYETTPGSCTPLSGTYSTNCVTGRIASVTLPTGGSITYAYTGGTNGTGIYSDGSTAGFNRTPSLGGEWQYSRSLVTGTPGTGSTWKTTVIDPTPNTTVINFSEDASTTLPTFNLYETQRQVYQGSTSGTLLSTTFNCWNNIFTNCLSQSVSSPITKKDAYQQLANGASNVFEVSYNGNGLPWDIRKFDWGQVLVQETKISYASLGNNILDHPLSVVVTDASSNLLSETTYAYDEANYALQPTTGTPQHTTISGSRGNATSVASYSSASASLTRHFYYYDTGGVYEAVDVNGATTTYSFSDSTASCGNSFPTSVTLPIAGLSTSTTWNCTGGVALVSTDPNSKTVTTAYSDPDFWRPNSVTDQLGNLTQIGYGHYSQDSSPDVYAVMTFNGGSSISENVTYFDGLGRVSENQRPESPASCLYPNLNCDTVSYTYDSVGRRNKVSMPCLQDWNAPCTGAQTTQTYDGAGRPLVTTDGGGGTITYSYSNNDVLQVNGPAPTGENPKQKQLEYDGLGRLISVCEVTAGTTKAPAGTCGQKTALPSPGTAYLTTYGYDFDTASGHPRMKVTQNAQGSSPQTRVYLYDLVGRLVSETNPETGNGAAGTTTYTYDTSGPSNCSQTSSAGDLLLKTDASGHYRCYEYDALHRITASGYSDSVGGSCNRFGYDNYAGVLGSKPTGVTVSNPLGRMVEAETDNCTLPLTPLTDEWFSYSARGELTDVYENTAHSGSTTYYHTTAGFWENGAMKTLSSNITGIPTETYGIDGEGRPSTVTASSGQNPVTSTTYSLSTNVSTVTFGSGDSDVFTLDPNTGRLKSYKFNVGTSQSDTGTLTWNPNGSLGALAISETITGTTDSQSCAYSHDDMARVASVNCGNSTWRQNFTYDALGNISKDSTGYTGLTFAPVYSATTNQYTSLPGITPTYDSDGRMTYDGVNHYTWTVDSKMATISGTTSASITYDALGRMVEKAVGSAYTQIVYSPLGAKYAVMSGQTLQKGFIPLPTGATAVYTSTGLAYYRHHDHLGSSRLATTPNRTLYSSTAYAPFGEAYASTGTTDLSFTGQDQDTTTGMHDFLARRFMPVQGRWLSPDPKGIDAVDPSNPQTWNRYAYVMNNPLALVDPFGEDCYQDGTCGQWSLPGLVGGGGGGYDPFGTMGQANQIPAPGAQCFDGGCTAWMTIFFDSTCQGCSMPDNQFPIPLVAANNGLTISAAPRLPWYKNTCITSALGAGALSAGIDAIGLIPEAGGLARMIGHGAGYVGVVADQTGAGVIKAFGGSTSAVNGLAGLGDTSAEGLVSTGLTVAGFIPGLGQAAAVGSLGVDVYKTVRAIGQCH